MTLGELKAVLADLPCTDEAEVLISYEGVLGTIAAAGPLCVYERGDRGVAAWKRFDTDPGNGDVRVALALRIDEGW